MTAFEFFNPSSIVDSEPLRLEGLWLHDPMFPDDTIRQFRFGKDMRSDTLAMVGVEQRFAGRQFPVTDFGEYANDEVSVKIQIPTGPNAAADRAALRSLINSRNPLVIRDNRGRMITGTLMQVSGSDQGAGAEYSFEVHRVDTGATEDTYDAGA